MRLHSQIRTVPRFWRLGIPRSRAPRVEVPFCWAISHFLTTNADAYMNGGVPEPFRH